MKVSKIFIILITIVACVILGAFVLNQLMPNVVTTMINSLEDTIFSATGMSFDFNADGNAGDSTAGKTYSGNQATTDDDVQAGVEGFQGGGSGGGGGGG